MNHFRNGLPILLDYCNDDDLNSKSLIKKTSVLPPYLITRWFLDSIWFAYWLLFWSFLFDKKIWIKTFEIVVQIDVVWTKINSNLKEINFEYSAENSYNKFYKISKNMTDFNEVYAWQILKNIFNINIFGDKKDIYIFLPRFKKGPKLKEWTCSFIQAPVVAMWLFQFPSCDFFFCLLRTHFACYLFCLFITHAFPLFVSSFLPL